MAARVLTLDGLDELVAALRRSGRRVIAPVERDGTITHDAITSAAELPRGWTSEQQPGSYRLVATADESRFRWATPSTSWKRFVHPPQQLIVRARREGDTLVIEDPAPPAESLAFFGVRSCDLAALGSLTEVFIGAAGDGATRPGSDVFIVAVDCAVPAGTCFCVSTRTGPTPTAGFDLLLTELADAEAPPRYVVEAATPRGHGVLESLASRPATDLDRSDCEHQREHAAASMGRTLAVRSLPAEVDVLRHDHWSDVAERCLACGNCTMVCPTCFCTDVHDTTDLTGTVAERWKTWDSCFTSGFSEMHGAPTRASIAARYRQWFLHKLVTWGDQFEGPGCVGCGRCITWCPVGIDLTAEAIALSQDDRNR